MDTLGGLRAAPAAPTSHPHGHHAHLSPAQHLCTPTRPLSHPVCPHSPTAAAPPAPVHPHPVTITGGKDTLSSSSHTHRHPRACTPTCTHPGVKAVPLPMPVGGAPPEGCPLHTCTTHTHTHTNPRWKNTPSSQHTRQTHPWGQVHLLTIILHPCLQTHPHTAFLGARTPSSPTPTPHTAPWVQIYHLHPPLPWGLIHPLGHTHTQPPSLSANTP